MSWSGLIPLKTCLDLRSSHWNGAFDNMSFVGPVFFSWNNYIRTLISKWNQSFLFPNFHRDITLRYAPTFTYNGAEFLPRHGNRHGELFHAWMTIFERISASWNPPKRFNPSYNTCHRDSLCIMKSSTEIQTMPWTKAQRYTKCHETWRGDSLHVMKESAKIHSVPRQMAQRKTDLTFLAVIWALEFIIPCTVHVHAIVHVHFLVNVPAYLCFRTSTTMTKNMLMFMFINIFMQLEHENQIIYKLL